MRVVQGEIVPPEQREPATGREDPAGAVRHRHEGVGEEAGRSLPDVEALRRDIERFQEGRSVSAKEDTTREMFMKFVKRNKGFSLRGGGVAGIAAQLDLSVCAWMTTNQAYAAYLKEQDEKRAQARQSVPAFVEAAHVSVQRRKFDDALAQVNVALDYDPEHGGARLLKGHLLASRKQFAVARPELERYLKSQPRDSQAARLARLCAASWTIRPSSPSWPTFCCLRIYPRWQRDCLMRPGNCSTCTDTRSRLAGRAWDSG